MKRTLVTPPVYFPVTLTEVKKHLRVDYTNDDVYLQALIVAATAKAEQYLRRRLVTQTWKIFMDAWPDDDFIVLPFGKLSSVTHVKYTDTGGTQTTWAVATEYSVDTDSDPGRIKLQYGKAYPTANLGPDNPIEIQFVCGYGAHTPLAITAATNASPIVITTAAHGRTANDTILVENVGGNTNADGTWKITVPLATTMGLLTSSGNAAWTSGGTAIGLDVPEPIRQAIKLMIGDLFENREDALVLPGLSGVHSIDAARALLTPYRLWEDPSG